MGKMLYTIKFRVAFWFKNFGCGSKVDLALLVLDIKERCVDSRKAKEKRSNVGFVLSVPTWYFYVDGSSRGNPSNAGIRGVLCDCNGKILYLFSYFMSVLDATSAEIYAIHRACQLLIDRQPNENCNITIFSDSKSVVTWCKGEKFVNPNLVSLILEIREILHNCMGLEIKFPHRELNSFTDCLVKNGSRGCENRLEWGDFV
ncbi:hypothetical protein Ddye_011874 [Dipteronia dyeriana]|uniref:RNase H type-1 domain-containing protein n=1 Tax=Dipteronia dyeriana TaxID=168575 RepID=A0AAE0CIR4_9ROSI|nr:hypothetical protein Ddye_011874 [Dipteronia dyeriana]